MNNSARPGYQEEIGLPAKKKTTFTTILSLFLFIFASFLIYRPVVDRYFVSDDFKVLYRVCREHTIFIKNFFRPLSDISIFLNYQLSGLNSIFFNSFNITIHGINGYLVFCTGLYFGRTLEKSKRNFFAISSAIIFLCYPFHNEAIVWLLGRGASMACMFSLLSLISYYKIENNGLKGCAVCIFYFISMSAFESTVFFPLIFLLLLLFEKQPARSIQKWLFVLVLTFILHLIIRFWIAGTATGNYGGEFFKSGMKTYFFNMAKVGGRLFLPPSKTAGRLMTISIILIIIIGIFLIRNFSVIRQSQVGKRILYLSGMLVISSFIPVFAGVSTQTSETDRLLYFPSVFLCMIAGLLISCCIKNFINRWIVLICILCYNLYFLEKNNFLWKNASSITEAVLGKIESATQAKKPEGKIYFINIPMEINGAYVFRQGFPEALLLYGADSRRFIAVSFLTRQEMENKTDTLILDTTGKEIKISPEIIIKQDAQGCRLIYDHGVQKYITSPGDKIYFWNLEQFESVEGCMVQNPG
jgi:protein O-mannosyl-transferase